MNKKQRELLGKAADILDQLATKCGGPGGKPGPCPVGGAGPAVKPPKGKPAKPDAAGKKPKAKSPPDPIESGSEDKDLSASQVIQFAAGLKKGMRVKLHMKYKHPDKDFAENPQDYPKGYDGVHITQTAKVKAVKVKDGKVDVAFEFAEEGYGASQYLKSHPHPDASSWTYKAEVLND